MFFQVPLNYFLNIGLLFEFIASRSTFSIKPPPLSIRYWHETILKLLFYFGFDRRVSRMTIDRTVQRFLWRTLQRRCLFFGSSAAPSVGVRLGPHCVGWPSKDRGGVAGSRASLRPEPSDGHGSSACPTSSITRRRWSTTASRPSRVSRWREPIESIYFHEKTQYNTVK